MKMFLAVVFSCLPAFGQAAYSGAAAYYGSVGYSIGTSCAAPNYCAYNGVDLIPAGTPPLLSNSDGTNNDATVYDSTYLGHTNFDGSTFSNAALLSPVTRLTDANSSSKTCSYAAGQGGSGEFVMVNSDTSLVGVACSGQEFVGLFNPSGANQGHFSAIHGGVFISTDLCVSGCVNEGSDTTEDFGSISFSLTDPTKLFTFGNNSYDITAANGYDGTSVCPYTINTSTGTYSLGTCVVDFKYGLPQYSAPNWAATTSYDYGAYIVHPLSTAEMATGGAWTTGNIYALGDIVVAQGGSVACMYRVTKAAGTATSGSSPLFASTAPCKNDILTDAAGNTWRGTNSTAQFLYQNTGAAGTSGLSFVIGGHPDILSTFSDGAIIVWTNVGPAYVPANANQLWAAIGGVSSDTSYGGNPSKYAMAISTNSYGNALGGYAKYTADQGTGADLVLYDATANAFQHLNTLTGIWTSYACATGNGFTCGSLTSSVVGTLTTITQPISGQNCPYYIHNLKSNTLGTFGRITVQAYVYSACSLIKFQVWNMQTSAYNAASSLQITYAGMNHSAVDTAEMVAFNGSASPSGYEGGWFSSVYPLAAAASQPGVSVFLKPGVNTTPPPYPEGCNTTAGTNPDCNLSDVLDSHLSCVGGCENRALHGCGTSYNYATLGPAFNAWQNMETCYPTATVYAAGSLPPTSAGPVSQFTHTFATGASVTFSTQFQISEWSQDGNWLFWSSDWGCLLGSTTGSAPAVWSSGTYYQTLALTSVPANPTSLCGYPWAASNSYVAGNTIDPLENTTGAGGVDDVFQALNSGTSGANSSLTNNQPACLQYVLVSGTWTENTKGSCFAGTNPPSKTALAVMAATESGTTGTFTVSGVTLNVGALVTLSGFTWTGGNGNGTFAVTGTVGTDCPGTNCGSVTTFQLAGMPSGLGTATTLGTAAAQGDTVCDSPSDNGSGSVNSFNPASCSGGVTWSDRGVQTQRGDMFAVNLGLN